MNPDSPIPTRAALVRPAIATAVVGLLGVVWGALVAGTAGVIAAVMATVVVLAFFALGQLAVQKVLASNPALGLNVALGVYMGQIVVLFILLAALRDATFFDPRVFAGTIVACALVWTAMIVVSLSKRPSAYVEPESTLGLSDDPEVIARLRKDGS
jgi:ATP synthase protein I